MYPELFELPFFHVTVKSYGLMMVIGFLSAVALIRRLSRNITPDPQMITNAALYSLIGGVVGARLFYVVHYFENFRDDLPSVFAIWQGGLELLGGVILTIAIIFLYLLYHKLPARRYLDILAIALLLALIFGRIGCFLNGCCYGKPSNLPWAVRFPYNSFAYRSQVNAIPQRGRSEPQLHLPTDYIQYRGSDGHVYPKAYQELMETQKFEVTKGDYRCLPVHPTQLYESAAAAFLCGLLYLFWRRAQMTPQAHAVSRLLAKPGQTFALMFVVYGVARFLLEFLRDDNPFEIAGLTLSQLLGLVMVLFGLVLTAALERLKPEKVPPPKKE
jgi:phosphatidylglycerol:prolipoprotein diacylglycerol transferase